MHAKNSHQSADDTSGSFTHSDDLPRPFKKVMNPTQPTPPLAPASKSNLFLKMSTVDFVCANSSVDGSNCKERCRFGCKNCRLVNYCGADCQRQDWPRHKRECKSPMGRSDWEPAWVAENRTPAFIQGGIGVGFGKKKFLWGNVPAIDILNLPSNEGVDYDGGIRLLFAASGDIRNLVKTISQIPHRYDGTIEVTLNDRDLDIVARNVIMLLIALVVEPVDDAVDCILHVWYSAFIRTSHMTVLRDQIRPLIDDVCQEMQDRSPEALRSKTWSIGSRTLRVVLNKPSWEQLLSLVDATTAMTTDKAREARAAVSMAPSRKDYRERYLFCQAPGHRSAINRFRDDGILLPFGASRRDFVQPNPTFFMTETWPMTDGADPLHGWPSEDVAGTSSGVASADIYGKLFYLVRDTLQRFIRRISVLSISFEMFQVDVWDLPDHVGDGRFSRIEVSNISDDGWVGIHSTLLLMVPFLQPVCDNPSATLVTLFMNAVDETMTAQDKLKGVNPNSLSTRRLLRYLPLDTRRLTSGYDPRVIRFNLARDLVTNYEEIFKRFSDKLKFSEAADLFGVSLKGTHSIIEQWPYRLKLRPGQEGAQEEFDRRLSGGTSGKECYLEWKQAY